MDSSLFKYHLDRLERFLKKSGLRNTVPRVELLRFLCSENNQLNSHFEADDAVNSVQTSNLKVSRASVFRNLTLFSEIGILRKSKFGENHFHYELLTSEAKYHHHLICRKCGKFIEFESGTLKTLSHKIARENSFEICDYRFEAFGICSECKKG